MIVDLLRNDLGRICTFRSIETQRLFDVETHPTLHQMTSTISGTLRPKTTYARIFTELFPSGSVTGAPKINTMKIIRALEGGQRSERGVYCGAIGYISPRKKAVFNVPIRTVQKKRAARVWNYRVGSGIVWDSQASQEWKECLIKTGVISHAGEPGFELFETVLWRANRLVYLGEHRERLERSAETFAFFWDEKTFTRVIARIKKKLRHKCPHRCQIFLSRTGTLRWNIFPLESRCSSRMIFLAPLPKDIDPLFLQHKTTYRPWYQDATEKIARQECFDVVFYDHKHCITEGSRSNVFIEENGFLYTPRLSRGLLPGILRQRLLAQHKCREKKISLRMLKKADAIYCGNSVRGLQKVILSPD
jgi:para-aminobenzoate synthetase / 4-amino-4-deoxychorismate lyase